MSASIRRASFVVAIAGLLLVAPCALHTDPEPTYDGKTLTQWIADLSSPDPQARQRAAWAVGSLGSDAAPAVPALVNGLAANDADTRSAAAIALACIGGPASPAAQKLQELAGNDPDPNVRGNAQLALMEIAAPPPPSASEPAPAATSGTGAPAPARESTPTATWETGAPAPARESTPTTPEATPTATWETEHRAPARGPVSQTPAVTPQTVPATQTPEATTGIAPSRGTPAVTPQTTPTTGIAPSRGTPAVTPQTTPTTGTGYPAPSRGTEGQTPAVTPQTTPTTGTGYPAPSRDTEGQTPTLTPQTTPTTGTGYPAPSRGTEGQTPTLTPQTTPTTQQPTGTAETGTATQPAIGTQTATPTTTPSDGTEPLPPIEQVQQVPEPVVPPDEPGVTLFLGQLQGNREAMALCLAELEEIPRQPPQDPDEAREWEEDVKQAGQNLVQSVGGLRITLHMFINVRTRRGLTEEFRLIDESIDLAEKGTAALQVRTGFDIDAWKARRNLQQQAAESRAKVVGLLAEALDERFEAEGLLMLLATDGVSAVRDEAVRRLRGEAEAEIDRITERELGIAFHDAISFKSAVQHKARSAVRHAVHKLLFKITSNQIIVELLGAPIIKWIETDLWPKLKAAFRNKGDLPYRTERSVASLERARMDLWALPPNATVDSVEAALRKADGAIAATKYLVGDVTRANRADLLTDIDGAINDVKRAQSLTDRRFLLSKLEQIAELKPTEERVRALEALLQAMSGAEITPSEQILGQAAGQPASGGAGFMSGFGPVTDPELARRLTEAMGAQGREGVPQTASGEVAGDYTGRVDGAAGEFVVSISGDPAFGLGWQMTPAGGGEVAGAGMLSATGPTEGDTRVFGGYFMPPGAQENGWAQVTIVKRNGTWQAELLQIWRDGRPMSLKGGQRIVLTRR